MKTYRPTTPSRRHITGIDYRNLLTCSEPEKSLVKGGKRFVGRNSAGRISVRHKGGGHKRVFRLVDFKYDKKEIPAVIRSVEYDPNRSGFIGLVVYADGEKRYVLLPTQVKMGDKVITSEKADVKPGNRLPLKNMPVGTFVYNVETLVDGGAKMIRSAGVYAELVAIDNGYALLKMPSTEVRKVPEAAWASVGSVSNGDHNLVVIGKAGRSRWKGVRPTVRGCVMNPVDHPHGGGEGKSGSGLRRSKNLWGKGWRGVKTRQPKKYSNVFIVSRRKGRTKSK